jgi:type II secretory pathway component PulM
MKFAQLSPREQTGIRWALGVLVTAVLWFVTIAPAWHVWQSSQSQLGVLAQQHADMLALQAQAKQSQSRNALGTEASAQMLQTLCANLGEKVKCSRQAQRMTVDVKGVSPQALAQAWTHARSQAQAVLLETHLQRQGDAWDGQWIWTLPEGKP